MSDVSAQMSVLYFENTDIRALTSDILKDSFVLSVFIDTISFGFDKQKKTGSN